MPSPSTTHPRAAVTARGSATDARHLVQFYESDDQLFDVVSDFLGAGLSAREPVVAIATAAHREGLATRLASKGFDLVSLERAGQVELLDAEETLSRIMVGGSPDWDRFASVVGRAIETMGRRGDGTVRAYGEMVNVLWERGDTTSAILLEEMWNELAKHHHFLLLCAYAMGGFYKETELHRICAAHDHVVAPENDGRTRPSDVHELTAQMAHQQDVERALRATLRERLEASREAARERSDRLMQITAAIADAVAQEEVFEALVDRAAAALGASTAGLWLLEEDRSVRLARSFGYPTASLETLARVPLDGSPSFPVLDTIRAGQPLWLASPAELLERYPHLAAQAATARPHQLALLPLVVQGQARGSLVFTFEREGIDADERQFLMLVARYSSQAVERLRLLDAERKSRSQSEYAVQRLAVLSRASRVLADSRSDLSEVLRAVTDEIVPECADSCAIGLLANGEAFSIVSCVHRDPEATEPLRELLTKTSFAQETMFRVATTGQELFLRDTDFADLIAKAQPAVGDWFAARAPGSLYVVPLRAGGDIVGSLASFRENGRPRFSEGDRLLLAELSERAAVACERARLHRESDQARLRADLSSALADTIIEADQDVFDVSLDAVRRGLHAERCSILVPDGDAILRFRAWRNLSNEYRHAVDGYSPWRPDEEPESVVVRDVERDPAVATLLPALRREGIGALAFIPLVTGGRLIGKIAVYYARPRGFSSQDLDMARALSNHVAAAITRFNAIAELQNTVKFNEMFTGVLGHNLRNPLNAIMATAQLVLRGSNDDKRVKQLLRIVSSGDRMSRMIDQLLDFTRVRVGKGIPLQPRWMDLAILLRQITDEIHTDAVPSTPFEHFGQTGGAWDADRLSQVFASLVGNAVQHGTPGQPVRVILDGREAEQVVVEIKNQGVIPPEFLGKHFDPVVAEHRRPNSRGLGLGLFISAHIVKGHGGKIDVESSIEHGTTVRVVLPRQLRGEGGA